MFSLVEDGWVKGIALINSVWIQNTPIVAMTASGIQGDRETCQRAGMDCLAKPAKGELLKKMVVECTIEGKRKRGFAQKDDQQAESSPSRKHPGTTFPKTHYTQYSNPLPIYPETAAPTESSSIPCLQCLPLSSVKSGLKESRHY